MSKHSSTTCKHVGPAVLTALGAAMAPLGASAGISIARWEFANSLLLNLQQQVKINFYDLQTNGSSPGAMGTAFQLGYAQTVGVPGGAGGTANGTTSFGSLGADKYISLGTSDNPLNLNLGGFGQATKGSAGSNSFGAFGAASSGGFANTTNSGAGLGVATSVGASLGFGVYSPTLSDGGSFTGELLFPASTAPQVPFLTEVSYTSPQVSFGPSAALGFGASAGYGDGLSLVAGLGGGDGGGTSTTSGGYGTIGGANFQGTQLTSLASIGGGALAAAGQTGSGAWYAVGYGATGGTYSTSAKGNESEALAGSASIAGGFGVVSSQKLDLNGGGFHYKVETAGLIP